MRLAIDMHSTTQLVLAHVTSHVFKIKLDLS